MKTIRRIFILLAAAGLIGGTAALVVKAADPGPASEPAKQATTATTDSSKSLNREQPAPSGSSQAKTTGSSGNAFTLNVTIENLGKMALVVTGVWGLEKSARNRRRTRAAPAPVPRSQPARLPRPGGREIFLPRVALVSNANRDLNEAD
jgi:hypothetical protein